MPKLFRPAKFSEVLGQDSAVLAIGNALRTGKLHHTILLTGHRGIGKTTMARLISMRLNCSSPQDHEPCGSCSSCTAIINSSSMSVTEMDAASHSSVDDTRALLEGTRFLASGKFRIYIIDEIHELSNAASNSLLKTLEEPPPHVYFILCTTELHRVLQTIQSRSQHYRLKKIPESIIKDAITKISNIPIDEGTAKLVARLSKGSLRDARLHIERLETGITYDQLLEESVPNTTPLIQALIDKDQARVVDALQLQINSSFSPLDINSSLIEAMTALFIHLSAKVDITVDARVKILFHNQYDNTFNKKLIGWIRSLIALDRDLNQTNRPLQSENALLISLLELIW